MKTRRWYRRPLTITLEGPVKSGVTSIIHHLASLPWLSTTMFEVDDSSPIHRMMRKPQSPECVLWALPFQRRRATGPTGNWTPLPSNPSTLVGDIFMERSQLYYDRVILPMVDMILSDVKPYKNWEHDPNREPARDYTRWRPMHLVRTPHYPDVMISLEADPQDFMGRLGDCEGMMPLGDMLTCYNERFYSEFPGPKFRVETRGRTLAAVQKTVEDVYAWIRVLTYGCPGAGLGGHTD